MDQQTIDFTLRMSTRLPAPEAFRHVNAFMQVLGEYGFSGDVRTANQIETFEFGDPPVIYDVSTAKRLIAAAPRQIFKIGLEGAFEMLDDPHGIQVDMDAVREHPERFPLHIPIIMADVEPYELVIDGWHRIARARLEGWTELPVVFLTEEESASIQYAELDEARKHALGAAGDWKIEYDQLF